MLLTSSVHSGDFLDLRRRLLILFEHLRHGFKAFEFFFLRLFFGASEERARWLWHFEDRRGSLDVLISQNVKEGVLKSVSACDSMTRILDQHLFAQINAMLADHCEWVPHKVRLLILDHLESLALFLGLKGQYFADHQVHDHAERPHVHLFVIRLLQQNFWRHISGRATAIKDLVSTGDDLG